jgi:signal transduction histidine kinase
MLKEKAVKQGITLALDVGPDAAIELDTDERKLKQILYNLLSNAVKFTPKGGSVRVKARRVSSLESQVSSLDLKPETKNSQLDRDFIEIAVADTGIGIKRGDMNKLFKPFCQLEPAYTKTYEGTGLGLAIMKRLVEFLGGTIGVESECGKGSTFNFVLPLRRRAGDPG